MSAAVADSSYSLVHGRPIRPLPKRRLRSRLSEDASAALFGPSQQPTTPLFYFPYNNYAGDTALGGTGTSIGSTAGNHNIGDSLLDSSDEEDNSNASVSRGVGNDSSGVTEGAAGPTDSYEWSENTNNKKKRKIPTPAGSGGTCNVGGNGAGGGGSQSSSGFSPTPTSTPRSRWKSSGSTQRSPLSTISSANHASLRRNCRRYSSSPSTDAFVKKTTGGKSSGDEPVTLSKARRRTEDNGSLSGLPPPPKQTQFTFVCESPVSASLALSTSSLHNSASTVRETVIVGPGYQKSMHTIGTQTSPMSNHTAYPSIPQQTKKKPGNRAPNSRREYAFQQQRRRRQEAMGGSGNNNGENWVCEFCEYEMIFGEAPEALIRQYEIKDRKERRKMAEKRRLLEKAKQKGKKNSGKNSGKKGGGNTHHNNSNSTAPPPPPPPSTTDSQGTQSDNTPLASASQTPALRPQRHGQQVQTESYMEESNNHVSTGRGAGGGGGGGGTRSGVSAGGIGSVAGVNSGGFSSL